MVAKEHLVNTVLTKAFGSCSHSLQGLGGGSLGSQDWLFYWGCIKRVILENPNFHPGRMNSPSQTEPVSEQIPADPKSCPTSGSPSSSLSLGSRFTLVSPAWCPIAQRHLRAVTAPGGCGSAGGFPWTAQESRAGDGSHPMHALPS